MTRLEKLGEELQKLEARRASLDKRIEEARQKYEAEENSEIIGLVREAGMDPITLAKLMRTGKMED